jgi:hypothetical protein
MNTVKFTGDIRLSKSSSGTLYFFFGDGDQYWCRASNVEAEAAQVIKSKLVKSAKPDKNGKQFYIASDLELELIPQGEMQNRGGDEFAESKPTLACRIHAARPAPCEFAELPF